MTSFDVALLGVACLSLISTIVVFVTTRPWELITKRRQQPKQYAIHLDGTKFFKDIDEAEINKLVHERLQTATTEAVEQFKMMLGQTMPTLVEDVRALHETEIKKQFTTYSEQFEALNQEAVDTFEQVHDDIMKRHKELVEGLNKRVVADYKFRMGVFDQRLDDIVSGYILESLGSQVDLGAQLPYILGKIEENKEQIKKDMTQ
jgi:hypothetical protein